MTLVRRDRLHHTYADHLAWPEAECGELIDGVAYVREPPAPSPLHQEIVGELYFQVRLALEGTPYRTYLAPLDVRLPKCGEPDDEIDTVLQPDVLIVRDRSKLDGRGMRGAPDWVAEVLSSSTASHDEIIKLSIYERAGVPEAWLVQPVDRILTIHRLEGRRYGRPTIHELKGRTTISAIPGVSIDWDRVMARLT